MRSIRFGAEWSWDREEGMQGFLDGGDPAHPNTGVTRAVCVSAGTIQGFRFDTTVRSISHEILFGYVLTGPKDKIENSNVFAAWTHSAWRETAQGDKPFAATKNSQAMSGLSIPIQVGALLWCYVYGWGHVYGAPGAHATVIELQGNVYTSDAAQFIVEPNTRQEWAS